MGISRKLAGRQPPDGPPVWTALKAFPSGIPPPISNIISRKVIPMGTSMRPQLLIFPVRANTAVPRDFSVPMLLNHLAPRRIIWATQAQVLTLLSRVGLSQSPSSVVRGRGKGFGIPRRPSMDRTRAVDSPQTKAPAP